MRAPDPAATRPLPRRSGLAWNGAAVTSVAAAFLSLAVSAAFASRRPDLTRGAAFLFTDEATNLFVADALHRGQSLYTAVAFPYGPVGIELYAAISAVLGNTPGVYLGVMAVLSALSVGIVVWLIRRYADAATTLAVVAVALLPTMPLPGAVVGGYTSSIYMPVERLVLLIAVLAWKDPLGRPGWRSLAIGAVLGVCQGIRFGSGAVVVAAVVLVDQLGGWYGDGASRRAGLRSSALVIAGFLLVEGAWAVWASLALPRTFALEFLWPLQLWTAHPGGTGSRWPTWEGWRMGATQYLMPAVAIVLGLAGGVRWFRAPAGERTRAWESQGQTMILLAFHAIASIGYFQHEHNFRQFAWTLVPAAALMAARLGPAPRIVLLVLCVPAAWPIISALIHGPSRDVVRLDVPRGYPLFVSGEMAARIRFFDAYTRRGPVLLVPDGSGWLYGYDVAHVTRHTWFYSASVIRPFEDASFAREVTGAAVVVRCTAAGLEAWPLPAAAVMAIEAHFTPTASAGGCTAWTPRREGAPGGGG